MLALAIQAHSTDSRLPGRRMLVVGLGLTGLSCARFLVAHGYNVAVTDSRAQPPCLAELQAELPDVAVFVDGFSEEALSHADAVILSPGVSVDEPFVRKAVAQGLPILGDIELFARFVTVPVVAVTGSNGKSTVTTLVGDMARHAGQAVAVGGNIGVPVLDLLQAEEPQLYVLELSSFQLETTRNLNPVAATILNISADHMDRYADLQAYAAAKARILAGDGTLVLNVDDALVMQLAEALTGRRIITFRLGPPMPHGFGILEHDGERWLAYDDDRLLAVSALRIHGDHNISNALAALALGQAVGLPMPAMLAALQDFRGLPHRTEWIAEHEGVVWFNDSKATNVGATLAALHGVRANRVVLIAGGQAKGQDFEPLREIMRQRVRSLILLGQDADLMQQQLADVVQVSCVDTLSAAVAQAAEDAQSGDAVLLSPACASFDMFQGYADRGTQFKDTVRRWFA